MRAGLVGLLLLGAACGGGPGAGQPPAPGTPAAAALPTDRIPGLPPCTQPTPPAVDASAVPAAVLPEGTVVTDVRETGPLTQVNGFVAATPVAVRLELEARDGITLLQSEDEGLESEMLMDAAGQRVFVKARAICDAASVLAVVLAPMESAGAVPVPSGTAAPSG